MVLFRKYYRSEWRFVCKKNQNNSTSWSKLANVAPACIFVCNRWTVNRSDTMTALTCTWHVDLRCLTFADLLWASFCERPSSKKMNQTLFGFGFNKEVETKSGKRFDVTAALPKTVQLADKPVKCEVCAESLLAKSISTLECASSQPTALSQQHFVKKHCKTEQSSCCKTHKQ